MTNNNLAERDYEVAAYQTRIAVLEAELEGERAVARQLAYWHTLSSIIICPWPLLNCDRTINGKDCLMYTEQAVECWLKAARQEALSQEE